MTLTRGRTLCRCIFRLAWSRDAAEMEGEEEGNSQRESRVVDPRGVVGMKDTPGLVAGFVVGCIG